MVIITSLLPIYDLSTPHFPSLGDNILSDWYHVMNLVKPSPMDNHLKLHANLWACCKNRYHPRSGNMRLPILYICALQTQKQTLAHDPRNSPASYVARPSVGTRKQSHVIIGQHGCIQHVLTCHPNNTRDLPTVLSHGSVLRSQQIFTVPCLILYYHLTRMTWRHL